MNCAKDMKNSISSFMHRLKSNYGNKLIIVLTATFFFQIGFIYSLVNLNQLPFYKNVLGINQTTYQIYLLIGLSPWSMKAFFGIVSDLFPLAGFQKTSYMVITGFLGTASLACLAVIDFQPSFYILAPSLIFVVVLEASVMDLLCEGQYTQIIHEKNIKEGDIITWVWIWRILGQLIAGGLIGFFVTAYHPQNVYWVCFVFSFPVIFLFLAGFLGEKYISKWYKRFEFTKLKSEWKLFTLAVMIALASVGMVFANVYGDKNVVLLYTMISSMVILALAYVFLPRALANCNMYIFMQEALYLRIMGALDYWFTADESCVQGGPNFGMVFYLTVSQTISCISAILGILLFQSCTKRWTFRFAFIFSVIIRVVGSLFDLFIVSRENIKLGLSDQFTLIFGDSIIMDIAFMLAKMPAILLTARLVHTGYESTIYAILAGYHDFGKNVAISLGTFLIVHLGIDFESRPCHYEKMPQLIIISHLILPLFSIPLVFLLIPSIRLDDVEGFDRYKSDSSYGDVVRPEEDSESDNTSQDLNFVSLEEEPLGSRVSVDR